VYGLKPTFGLVPADGVVPVSWTLDHVGPIARTARDLALILSALVPEGGLDVEELERGAMGLGIGVAIPDAHLVDPEVKRSLEMAFLSLGSAGASVTPLPDLPAMSTARTCLWAIASVEAADYHRTMLAASADRYHPVVRRRLARGRLIPAVDYVRAQRVRHRLVAELQAASRGFDVLVLPLVPVPAYPLEARQISVQGGLEEVSTVVTQYTPIFSLTGWPALAVPFGRTRSGLPIGIQVAARPGGEALALRVARALEIAAPEEAAPWGHGDPPNLP
jgi:aspartyl-tRNA(Asn)/glutamyl-tRNA(Gln) amidotransferase subunit A